MTEHDVERMLESTDLSTRSKIRTSLRRDLLDRDPRRAPRASWVLNAFALGVMAVGVITFGALVLGGGSGITPGAGSEQAESSTPELPTATPALPMGLMEPTPTIVPFHHTVQAGETLLDIVQIYGWENGDIIPTVLQMNGLTSEDQITVGMTLMIPPRIETAPFEPCPAGYNPGMPPPTMVSGQEVPSSETATPFPTIVPCNLPTSAPVMDGSTMTATPIPFDPAAPTVPPSGFMLPTPTPAAPAIDSIEELSGLVGFNVVDFASVPAGYELQARGAQIFAPEIKSVTTTYIRRAAALTSYIQLKQIEPSMSLAAIAAQQNIQLANSVAAEVGDQDALWIEGYDVGLATSSVSYVANVLIWNTDEFSFVLVADNLRLDEMIKLAEELE